MKKKVSKRDKKRPPASKPRRPAKSKATQQLVKAPLGAPTAKDFPVVGIGASAGGLEALEALLKSVPNDTGMAFVVVTHQHPGHTSMLPELLARSSVVPVVQAVDGVQVTPNRVYVAPPGALLEIVGNRLHVLEAKNAEAPRLPIDYFFRSLALNQMEKAICIVLSGNGTDGTLGLREIKGESGMAMVQEPRSAKYGGMPSSAIATGLADYVLPPAKMPERLVAYARGPYLSGVSKHVEALPDVSEPLQKILVCLRARTRHDFSAYKPSTVRRRIERRMNVHQIKDLNSYLRLLQENAREVETLFQELLISVTSFFRDPQAFDVLAQKVLPTLVKECPDDGSLRVWVPGCSTGEEAYSIAILLREVMEKLKRTVEVQIFATDLDNNAINRARLGKYPDGIAVDLSPARLERHFVREDGGYRIRKDLREMVIFAPQSVISDPPFTKLDLISCRNVLIYFDGTVQKRLIPTFHYALRPGGVLFLGPSETVSSHSDLFVPIDTKWKIFRRRAGAAVHPLELPAARGKSTGLFRDIRARGVGRDASAVMMEKALIERFAPPSVIVNDRGDILYIHGRTGAYLEPAAGQPRLNVLDMAREGLEPVLASAMQEAQARHVEVKRPKVQIKGNGSHHFVNITASPLHEPESLRGLLLITFRTVAPEPLIPTAQRGKRPQERGRIRDLEHELKHTKESLRSTVEELATSNEELKSANEELQSMNEELQSTNEELETSKEEMQSLNEELTTVNTELQSKLEDLSRANDDMQNLLNSTDVATIFVDNELRIKRYTEQATRLIKLIPTDIGRPLGDLVSNLKRGHFLDDARDVLRSLVYKEADVQATDDRWYLMRLAPYRTSENVIDGLVITFVDIDRVKQAEINHADGNRSIASLIDGMRRPVLVLDSNNRVTSANRAFHDTFRTKPEVLEGRPLDKLGNGPWSAPALVEPLQRAVESKKSMTDVSISGSFAGIGRRSFIVRGWPLEQSVDHGAFVLEIEDVADAKTPRS